MKLTMLLIVIRTLGKIPKELVERLGDFEIREQVDIYRTTALCSSAVIIRVLESCHSNTREKQSANDGDKQEEMKEKIIKEYPRRTRKLLKNQSISQKSHQKG